MSTVKEIRDFIVNSLKLVKDIKTLKDEINYKKAYPPLQCEMCREVSNNVIVYHQHTFYADDPELNYVAACPICKIKNDEYLEEQWAEYYRGCL